MPSQSDNQEKVYVSWSEETIRPNMSAELHVRVVHASIVLLTCGPPNGMWISLYLFSFTAWCLGKLKHLLYHTSRVQKTLKPSSSHNFSLSKPSSIFEVLVVDRAWLERGSRYKLRENILTSYSYRFELMAIVPENKLVLE